MGNTCVGPNLKNGFLQSVSAVVWRARTPDDLLPPKEEGQDKSVGGNASHRQQTPTSTSLPVQNKPPEPVKIPESHPQQLVDPVRIPESHPKQLDPIKIPESHAKRQLDPIKIPESHAQKQLDSIKIPESHIKQLDHVKTPESHAQQNESVKPKKAQHVRRVSSAGLQANSVLQRKTGNLKELYSLGRKLGQGQFGTTHLCVEKATGKEFACKSITKRKLVTEEDLEDVRREIQIMHHLAGHPNVISIIGAYEDAVAVHVVMELCAGGELFDRIVQRGHYSERKAAELARVIGGVVETCHSLGVMHRDLKPENFLFADHTEEAPLKTIDFGLSVFFKPGTIHVLSVYYKMSIKKDHYDVKNVLRSWFSFFMYISW